MPHPFESFTPTTTARGPIYNAPEDLLEIEVTNPITHGQPPQYTDYEITTRTNIPAFIGKGNNNNNGNTPYTLTTRKRYSEFVKLRQQLSDRHPQISLPTLPTPSTMFNYSKRFNSDFIDDRRRGLEIFLTAVASHPLLQKENDVLISFLKH